MRFFGVECVWAMHTHRSNNRFTVMNVMVDGATNRISSSGFVHDAAGNLTTMPYGGSSSTELAAQAVANARL